MKNVFSALLYKTILSHKKMIIGTFLLFAININFILLYIGHSAGEVIVHQLKTSLYTVYHFSFMLVLYNIFVNQVIRKEVNEKTICSYLMCPVHIRDIWLSYGFITYIVSFVQYAFALLIAGIIFKIKYQIMLLPGVNEMNVGFIFMLLTFLLSFAFVYSLLFRDNAFLINLLPIIAFLIMFNAAKINFNSPLLIITAVALCIGILLFIYSVMRKINNEKFYLNVIGS